MQSVNGLVPIDAATGTLIDIGLHRRDQYVWRWHDRDSLQRAGVELIRDDMANIAWAVERVVLSAPDSARDSAQRRS